MDADQINCVELAATPCNPTSHVTGQGAGYCGQESLAK